MSLLAKISSYASAMYSFNNGPNPLLEHIFCHNHPLSYTELVLHDRFVFFESSKLFFYSVDQYEYILKKFGLYEYN